MYLQDIKNTIAVETDMNRTSYIKHYNAKCRKALQIEPTTQNDPFLKHKFFFIIIHPSLFSSGRPVNVFVKVDGIEPERNTHTAHRDL